MGLEDIDGSWLEAWGHLELNIKDDVVGCWGAYTESLINIGHDLAKKTKLGGLRDIEVPWLAEVEIVVEPGN